MATGRDRLEKNFDKLEKFFSRTKKAAAFRDSLFGGTRSGTPSSPPAQITQMELATNSQIFPHPSFIRPTSTRMLARDEAVLASQPTRRAHSLPEAPTTSHQTSTRPPTIIGIYQSPQVPRRTSSLLHRRNNASIAGLLEFSFAHKATPSPDGSLSSSSTASPLSSPVQKRSLDNSQALLHRFHSNRPDTPPLSDHEECPSPLPLRVVKTPPAVPPRDCLTPEPSPSLSPVLEDDDGNRKSDGMPSQEMQSPRPVSLGNPETSRFDVTPLRKALSDSTLSASTPLRSRDPVLKEPSLDEFLSLSDDDIADGRPQAPSPSQPPTCGLPPDPPSPSSPAEKTRCYPLLTLSSPLTSRPATAAAFEAARIAARYKFDLVYVVNLWPKNLGITQHKAYEPARTARLTALGDPLDGQASLACINPRTGMTGRLLAGYGLPSVMSPFRISAPVHQKVLRTDGWLEYRSEHAAADEFSRGYSCSFYTGVGLQGSTGSGPDSSASPTLNSKKKRPQPNNRGIVFAAYRLPRLDGTTLASDLTELDALYADAETLVEMLIDIHSRQRARHPVARYDADETGPMPTRPELPSLAT